MAEVAKPLTEILSCYRRFNMCKCYRYKILIMILLFTMQNCIPAIAATNTPFKKLTIPGEIWACDFDNGGNGVAYLKNSKSESSSNYREGENLNIYEFDFGKATALESGQWMKYTLNVAKAGYYEATVYYATPAFTTLEFLLDEEIKTSCELETTPDYQQCFNQNTDVIYLPEGTHTLKLSLVAGGVTLYKLLFKESTGEGETNLRKTSGSYRTAVLPTKIEAEDFDLGIEGSYSNDGENSGKKYRKKDGIDIFSGDTGYYITLNTDEWVKYTFTVPAAGAYNFQIAIKGTSNLNCFFDDFKNPLTVKANSDSGFKTIVVSPVYFEKGIHSIKLTTDNSLSIDYLKLTTTQESGFNLSALDQAEETALSNEADQIKINKIYRNLYVSEQGNDQADGSEAAPYKTIARAKDEIVKLNDDMDGDIVIHILPGYYKIDKTEKFDIEHSGKNGFNVIIQGSNTLNPPVISGGMKVANWKQKDDYIWMATLEGVEDVRNLYINGYLSQRARSKYRYTPTRNYKLKGSEYADDGIVVSAQNFPEHFSNPSDLELVWDMDWTSQRTPVANIVREGDEFNIIMDQPYYHWSRTKDYDLTKPGASGRFYIENAIELLDEPGEFYFNKAEKTLYYYPFKNEDLNQCEAYIGSTELLFEISGESSEERISNIIFDNLDIRYGAWNEVSIRGLDGAQADKILDGPYSTVSSGGTRPPAQMTIKYADNIHVRNCEFSCLGSGAIDMPTAVSNASVIGNSIHDISGSGIMIGSWDHNEELKGMKKCNGIDILNNVFRRTSREFRGGCAISVYYEKNINIMHNDIKETPYTGITLGWGWGAEVDFGGIKVSYNKIEDAVSPPVFDGAHIYTLGPLRNSEISYNYLLETKGAYGAIYPDSGSGWLKVHHNVMQNCGKTWFFCGLSGTHDIEAYDNYSTTAEYTNYGKNKIETPTIIKDGNWIKEALGIIQSAGLETKYKRLLKGLEYPVWRTNFLKTTPSDNFKEVSDDSWIQAEDYKNGGEGIGYHKLTKNNNTTYREGDVVIYKVVDGNYVVGSTFAGEWLSYNATIPESKEYKLKIRGANAHHLSSGAEPYLNVYVDNKLLIDSAPFKQTDGWTLNVEDSLGVVFLKQGDHEIKFEFVDNGISFDSFKFIDAAEVDIIKNSEKYDECQLVLEEDLVKFVDVQGHWAESEIMDMLDQGVIKGKNSKEFDPNGNLTREQSALLVLRATGLLYNEAEWQNSAAELGIITDFTEVQSFVTRIEFVNMLMKAYEVKNGNFNLAWESSAFKDESLLSVNDLIYVLGAKSLGVIVGNSDGCFHPFNHLTRAEAAVIMSRYINKK